MLKALAPGLLLMCVLLLLVLPTVFSEDSGYPRCNCDDEGSFWSIENILSCQKFSDFLIAMAYFSIPIELLYFVSCSNVPFKWVLFEFIAFIVLCGMTHLLNGWTYDPHPFQLVLALTVFKILTALVSCATAITLFTLIPLLLKVKVRELKLKEKAMDLGREVGIIMKKKEAGLHVRMLTHVIRKSLDRHTILYTTLVELSKTLGLKNCAIWMPNETKTMMNLTHELGRGYYSNADNGSVPITDPDVVRIKQSDQVNILRPSSVLASASSRESSDIGPIAAIRMPMLRVSNFKGGTPEMVQACYAILVLVLPGGQPRSWTSQELEIIKVVADQVAVALSHAAVLEESQLISKKLEEQNRALQQARMNAIMASEARVAFQKVMSNGMKKPMHSILGLISMLQDGNLSSEQQLIVDAMMKTSNVLSTLINDVMEISRKDNGRFPVEMKCFHLHSLIREVACVAKCLCAYGGVYFSVDVDKSSPDYVMGDERRVFQVMLHMIGSLLEGNSRRGSVTLRVMSERGSQGRNYQRWAAWRDMIPDVDVYNIRIEMTKAVDSPETSESNSAIELVDRRSSNDAVDEGLSFNVCKKLVQMMQGNIWVIPDAQGFARSTGMALRFQLRPSIATAISESAESSEHPHSNSHLRGLQVLLADADNLNRAVTRKFLEKLGCSVTTVSSGFDCLSSIIPALSSFQIVILDLQLPELDGFEIATRIRKFRSHGWPLIVALTASFDENVLERCLQCGMNGVIREPIMLQGIADELRRVLLQANKVVG